MTERRDHYAARAAELAAQYDGIDPEAIHGWIMRFLGKGPLDILDVGAGSGRDAAWFTSMGHRVLAVEPSEKMKEQGMRMHPGLQWVDDHLPDLSMVASMGRTYDFIHLSAVWMHLHPEQRPTAFATVMSMARPNALLAFLVRLPHDPERGMHPTEKGEIPQLAKEHGCEVVLDEIVEDHSGREDVNWMHFALRTSAS